MITANRNTLFAISFKDQGLSQLQEARIKRHLLGLRTSSAISYVENPLDTCLMLMIFTDPTKTAITKLLLPIANQYGVDFTVQRQDTEDSFYVRQTELNSEQTVQQDAVDNVVFEMINAARNRQGMHELEWDMEIIAAARELLVEFICGGMGLVHHHQFYAELTEQD